jgi:lipopolysaccharide O-acetyltransferase
MAVGARVWIGPRAWLEVGGPALDAKRPVLRLGDGVVLRHHVTISAAESIVIEDDVLVAAWTSIYDSDHTLGPDGNAIWYPHVTGPVRIGRGTWLGERVTVLRGADIGRHCIVGAGSVVKGAIPDYSVAVGAPARVVGSTREMIERARRRTPGGGHDVPRPDQAP